MSFESLLAPEKLISKPGKEKRSKTRKYRSLLKPSAYANRTPKSLLNKKFLISKKPSKTLKLNSKRLYKVKGFWKRSKSPNEPQLSKSDPNRIQQVIQTDGTFQTRVFKT